MHSAEAQGKGDISILPERGHFYFALTGQKMVLTMGATLVFKPLLAASCHPTPSPEPDRGIPLDQHYENLRFGMRGLLGALGIAA